MSTRHYDLAVIGTGPAGLKGASHAARLGKRVVIIEKDQVVGGVAVNTGTIPSKALREAVLHLTGTQRRGVFTRQRFSDRVTLADLAAVAQGVIRVERECIRTALAKDGVDLVWGTAHFEGPNLLHVQRAHDSDLITADNFLVAIGTRPARPNSIPFDGRYIFTSDDVLTLDDLPESLIVVGGGVIGTEYACILGALGIDVTLLEGRDQVLGFLDSEITEAFQYHIRRDGIRLRLGEKVKSIEHLSAPQGQAQVQATLESGKKLRAHALLYAVGRQGMCSTLGLENVGLQYDDRERLKVDAQYRTAVPHIFAAGDVIGFPALASTAMEQGRLAVCHMYNKPAQSMSGLFPFGIYAVPEISMVGQTEQQLTQAGIPYESGVAYYKELARGQLLGDDSGMLKLLIHQESHHILGVHAIGSGATELVHIGQSVMALGGTVEYFVHSVFNYPTLAEAYKVAAADGLRKLRHLTAAAAEEAGEKTATPPSSAQAA